MPSVGSQEDVFVSYVNESSETFCVQVSKDANALDSLMDAVHEHCSGGAGQQLALEEIKPATPCCAPYEDGAWYRAVILNCDGEYAEVSFKHLSFQIIIIAFFLDLTQIAHLFFMIPFSVS